MESLIPQKSSSYQPQSSNMFSGPDSDEYTLPRATLTQIIKEMLPEDVRMSCQSSDLIIQLTMNFLNHLSDNSNQICNLEGKKTITPSHVAKALKDLKMNNYLAKILELGIEDGETVELSEKQTKEMINQKIAAQGGKKKKKRGSKGNDNNHGMTQEELIAEQQRLFENARLYNYGNGSEQYNQYENYSGQGIQSEGSINGGGMGISMTQSAPITLNGQGADFGMSQGKSVNKLEMIKNYSSSIQRIQSTKEVDEMDFENNDEDDQEGN